MTNESDKKVYQIGFYVKVEVEAVDEIDAIHIANAACDWPGDWQPPSAPIKHTGTIYKKPVEAEIVRSQALMVKAVDHDGRQIDG